MPSGAGEAPAEPPRPQAKPTAWTRAVDLGLGSGLRCNPATAPQPTVGVEPWLHRGSAMRSVIAYVVLLSLPCQARDKPAQPVEGRNWTIPGLGMEFVWLPSMKCWVGKHEVTNAEYRAFRPKHDSREYAGHSLNGDRQPVVEVSYVDAVAFGECLTERGRKVGRLPAGYGYRLPDGQEWTAFAQCGDGRRYPWGNEWPPKYGNYSGASSASAYDKINGYDDGFATTCHVGKSGENEWGLYGVRGNVWEWTRELCGPSHPAGKERRVLRGAAWYYELRVVLQCNIRYPQSPTDRFAGGGFRLLLSRREPK